jgi:hypothetical protein
MWLALQVPIIAILRSLRTMRKHVQTFFPVGFDSVSLVREYSVLTRPNLCLLYFAVTAAGRV